MFEEQKTIKKTKQILEAYSLEEFLSREDPDELADSTPLNKHFKIQIHEIEQALVDYLKSYDEPRAHYGMIHYHFGFADHELKILRRDEFLKRGKRIRALLCVFICRIMNVPSEIAKIIMLASEVMHCASLVHDDIQDNDSIRWGRPTINALFGVEQGINVGDALIGMVYQLLLRLRSKGVEPKLILDVIEIYNNTHIEMCEGQHLDITYKYYQNVEIEEYFNMVLKKTASVCECITKAISILAGCDQEARENLCYFGQSLGMLYQICDDIRGIWSKPEELGKQVGQDICLQKATLPLIYGFKYGSQELRKFLLEKFGNYETITQKELIRIRCELSACGVDQRCYRDAKNYYGRAVTALKKLNVDCPEIKILESILNSCLESTGMNDC